MSEPRQYIKNSKGEVLGFSKFGVFWSKNGKTRLGEFYDSKIFDNEYNEIGYFKDPQVYSSSGRLIGTLSEAPDHLQDSLGFALIYNYKVIGFGRGYEKLFAAAGFLFFETLLCDAAS